MSIFKGTKRKYYSNKWAFQENDFKVHLVFKCTYVKPFLVLIMKWKNLIYSSPISGHNFHCIVARFCKISEDLYQTSSSINFNLKLKQKKNTFEIFSFPIRPEEFHSRVGKARRAFWIIIFPEQKTVRFDSSSLAPCQYCFLPSN